MMKNLLCIAFCTVGIAVMGMIGCKSAPKNNARGEAIVPRPAGVDEYIQAMRQYEAGNPERAMAQLAEATRINPKLIMPRIVMGDLLRGQGEYNKAVEQYETVTKLDPYYASNWYNLGVCYQLMQRLKDAATSYARALTIRPDYASANVNMGLVQLYLGNTDDAVKHAQKGADLAPKDPAAWANLGVALDAKKEYAKAEEAYRKSLDLDPDNVTTLMNLASNLLSQEKGAEAVSIMEVTVRKHRTASTLKRYGDALARSGQYARAVEQYEAALAADAMFYPAMNEIGFARIAEYRRGMELDDAKRADAVAMWKKSLELNPNQPRISEAVKQWGNAARTLSP